MNVTKARASAALFYLLTLSLCAAAVLSRKTGASRHLPKAQAKTQLASQAKP